MKNLMTYPAHSNRPTFKSRFNHMIDLAPLQKMVEQVTDIIQAQILTLDTPELYKLFMRKSKEERELRRAKAHNFKTGLKWNMLRRVSWRKKVLEDLGGEEALAKWDIRAAKAKKSMRQPYRPPAYKRPPLASLRLGQIDLPPVRTRFDVKTDETGCFRLAPIPRSKRPDDYDAPPLTETQKWERKEAWRLRAELRAKQHPQDNIDESTLKGYWYKDEAANTLYRLAPIPLLPDELRGNWDEAFDESPNTNVIRPAARPHEAKPKMRDLGSSDDGELKILSAPKLQTRTSALQGRDPASAGCALVRDDNEGEFPDDKNHPTCPP